MKNLILFAVVLLLGGLGMPRPAVAADSWTTMCMFENEMMAPKLLAWNLNTRVARLETSEGKAYTGKVTLDRPHSDDGRKVNVEFDYGERYGVNIGEFMIFPVSKSETRVIGAGYIRANGQRHLTFLEGNFEVRCLTP